MKRGPNVKVHGMWNRHIKQECKLNRRDYNLRTTYGLSSDQYDNMLKGQDGKCKICLKPETALSRSLAVDHCHKTHKIRGLLCGNCNRGLGAFKDNPVNMLRAIQYLKGNL